MVIGVGAALLAAGLFGVVAAGQAWVIRRRGLRSAMMLLVLLGYLVGWGLHLVAIAYLPLYLAQVAVGTSLVVTALIAARSLGEPLRAVQWTAVVAMILGLGLLALASGDVGESEFTTTTTVVLYALLATTTLVGWLAWRWQHPTSGILLGVLSGVAYGASPVASRALVDFDWGPVSYATTLSIGLFGALGFVLYSLAFNRTTVVAATAPQVLLQTALPAVVGVVLFADQVRSGWWPVALGAFGLAVAAGVVLCEVEARLVGHDGIEALIGDELGPRAAS